MRLCTTFLWLFLSLNGFEAINIVKMMVPDIIQYGTERSIVLDCDYTYGEKNQGLVVKWFFKTKMNLVYQWIQSQKPQEVGIMRGRLDLSYKASDDPLKMYRAMRIVKLDTDLSGEYFCVVSSFIDEDYKSKNMTIFVPETSFRLVQNKTDDNTVNVICAADGAYPAPNLTLSTLERNLTGVNHQVSLVNGRYSAVASVTLNDADLLSPAVFICILRIEEAKYIVRKETIYYPGPISTTPELPTAADMQLAATSNSRGLRSDNIAITILSSLILTALYL